MSQHEMTILVLGHAGRTAAAVGQAVAAARSGGVDCDLVADRPASPAVDDLVRRCRQALGADACEPVVVRVRLTAEDLALVAALPRDAQEDLLVDPARTAPDSPPRSVPPAPAAARPAWRCRCDGLGCVQCMGEACP